MQIDYSELAAISSVLEKDEDDWNQALAGYACSDHNGLLRMRLLRRAAPEGLTVHPEARPDMPSPLIFRLFGVIIAAPEFNNAGVGQVVDFRVKSDEARAAAEEIVRAEVQRLCELDKLFRKAPPVDRDQLVISYADPVKVPAFLETTRG